MRFSSGSAVSVFFSDFSFFSLCRVQLVSLRSPFFFTERPRALYQSVSENDSSLLPDSIGVVKERKRGRLRPSLFFRLSDTEAVSACHSRLNIESGVGV